MTEELSQEFRFVQKLEAFGALSVFARQQLLVHCLHVPNRHVFGAVLDELLAPVVQRLRRRDAQKRSVPLGQGILHHVTEAVVGVEDVEHEERGGREGARESGHQCFGRVFGPIEENALKDEEDGR